jgi:hypothetical protein
VTQRSVTGTQNNCVKSTQILGTRTNADVTLNCAWHNSELCCPYTKMELSMCFSYTIVFYNAFCVQDAQFAHFCVENTFQSVTVTLFGRSAAKCELVLLSQNFSKLGIIRSITQLRAFITQILIFVKYNCAIITQSVLVTQRSLNSNNSYCIIHLKFVCTLVIFVFMKLNCAQNCVRCIL